MGQYFSTFGQGSAPFFASLRVARAPLLVGFLLLLVLSLPGQTLEPDRMQVEDWQSNVGRIAGAPLTAVASLLLCVSTRAAMDAPVTELR